MDLRAGKPCGWAGFTSSPCWKAFIWQLSCLSILLLILEEKFAAKSQPTLGAGSIHAGQLDRFPSVGLQEARLFPTRPQRLATRRTPGPFLLRQFPPVLA